MKRILKYLFSISGLILGVFAQAQTYELTQYDFKDGLNGRIFRTVIQDRKGFIWAGGHSGLFRFDGQEFKAYQMKLSDTTGLRSNRINVIAEDHQGHIWVGTSAGLHVIEDEQIHFQSLGKHQGPNGAGIRQIEVAPDGDVWFATYEGLFQINATNNKLVRWSGPNMEAFPESETWGISFDRHGNTWIGARSGVYRIDAQSEKLIQLACGFDEAVNPNDINFFVYHEYEPNRFAIESSSGVLHGELISEDSMFISRFTQPNGDFSERHFIYRLLIDESGFLWTATYQNRFHKYRIEGKSLIEESLAISGDLDQFFIHAINIYQDRQANVWVPNGNGLFKLSKSSNPIESFPFGEIKNCFEEGFFVQSLKLVDSSVWVSTPAALYRFSKAQIQNSNCPEQASYLRFPKIRKANRIMLDSKNRLWVLTDRDGLWISQLDENFNPEPFVHITKTDGLPHAFNYDILETRSGEIWLANYVGLVRVIPKNGIESLDFEWYHDDPKRKGSLSAPSVYALAEDAQGKLWVGTVSGLNRLEHLDSLAEFKIYESDFLSPTSLSNNNIKCLFTDREGRLWIGTNSGLNLYDPNSDSFIRFGISDGIPNLNILAINEDPDGYLWIGTINGLIRTKYLPESKSLNEIRLFGLSDGIPDLGIVKNAIEIDGNGTVYLGFSEGLAYRATNFKTPKRYDFNLVFTEVAYRNNKDQKWFEIPVSEGQTLKLKAKQNNLKFRFASLDLTSPKFNRYSYQLNGGAWQDLESQGVVSLNDLSSGFYQLRIRSYNSYGYSAQHDLNLRFRVFPPPWRSTSALLAYIFIFLGLVYLFYRRNMKLSLDRLEKEQAYQQSLILERERLRKENAADFHDELGSQLTKVSLYLTMAERSLEQKENPKVFLDKIRLNIKDLSSSFRDLLWVIDPKKDSLADTFIRLQDFGEELFKIQDIRFSSHGFSPTFQQILLDPPTKKQIVLIFKEAMHNVVKHAKASQVILKIKSNGSQIQILLQDNGIGFSSEQKSKGRGLKNMKLRAEKMKGKISFQSSEEGSKIKLSWLMPS